MLSLIRKNQYFLTFFIVLLTIVSFIWLYNRTNLSQVGVNDVALVYGHVLQKAELERQVANYRLAIALGLTDFVRDLGGFAENEEMALTSFIFNLLIIQHESHQLGIIPSDEKIAEKIESLSLFQTEGAFDSNKYALFMKEKLLPRGFTERHLEEVIGDALAFEKLYRLISSPVIISEAQEHEAARIYQTVLAEVLPFNQASFNNFPKEIISDAEKKDFYEKNKSLFMTPEERVITYLCFELPNSDQKRQGKERIEALEQLSNRTLAFKQQSQEDLVQGKSFQKSALEHGFKPITTNTFTKAVLLEKTSKSSRKPPQSLVEPTFKMNKEGGISEVLEEGDHFYLFSLDQIIPSHLLPLQEVDSKIEKILQEKKALQKAREAGSKALNEIHETMKNGKNFLEATRLLQQNWMPLKGNLFQQKPLLSQQEKEYFLATLPLREGELSDLNHAPWGDFIIYLQQRLPLSSSDWSRYQAEISKNLMEEEKRLLFFEWLHQERLQAKITLLDSHRHRNLFSSIFGK